MTARLLDTDVCISVLRGRETAARARLREMPKVAVSAVTVAELGYGAARSSAAERNREEVARFVEAVDVIDLDADAAWHSGEIRAELAAAGTPIGAYDLLIAGQARSRDLVLVTGNVREFGRVPGLQVEAW